MSRFDTAFTPLGMVGVPNSLVIKMESVKNTIKPLIAPGARFRGEPALSFASHSPTKTINDSTSTPALPHLPLHSCLLLPTGLPLVLPYSIPPLGSSLVRGENSDSDGGRPWNYQIFRLVLLFHEFRSE